MEVGRLRILEASVRDNFVVGFLLQDSLLAEPLVLQHFYLLHSLHIPYHLAKIGVSGLLFFPVIRPVAAVHIPYIFRFCFFPLRYFFSPFLQKKRWSRFRYPCNLHFFSILIAFSLLRGSNCEWSVLLCSILLFTPRRCTGKGAGVLAGFVG